MIFVRVTLARRRRSNQTQINSGSIIFGGNTNGFSDTSYPNLRRNPVKQVITTDRGPKAIGPYSQAIKANGLIFISGQIPLDPGTQQLIEGDITKQTERVMENLKGIVEASGSSLDKVLKTTVFLSDMGDFAAMNAVYGRYFTEAPPARATVQVARLPRDVRVEIELIAEA
jgi:2-iminobutanoate/2-iminopropanoate deaminase